MPIPLRPRRRAPAAALALSALFVGGAAAHARPTEDDPDPAAQHRREIVVTGQRADAAQEPATTASIDAARIETTINAVNVEDTLRTLPSLVVRKRHIGDTQAPLATRTSGLGSSARSLIYADGALLSALIGNNNTNASPQWSLVSPEEIARIDVIYGPFSAAYPGNAIGGVVTITTRLPDKLEGTLSALTNLQHYAQYGTRRWLPSRQVAATLGDRFGPLSLFLAATHTDSQSQPIGYATLTLPTTTTALGGYDAQNRTGAAIRVIGATGLERQRQDTYKLKAALDLTPAVRLSYTGGLFLDDTVAEAETYQRSATTGAPVYASALTSGLYTRAATHWSHALTLAGDGKRFDWQLVGTVFDYVHDEQRTPTGTLPAADTGGAGQIVRLDGTGWKTLDASGTWRSGADDRNALRFGAHWDRFELTSNRYALADWREGDGGQLNLVSAGKTQTHALWAQDGYRVTPALLLTLGGRYEWWRAFDGYNYSLSPALAVNQPERRAQGFSPKASIAWTPAAGWTTRLSAGRAYRFPTVGELYQAITTGLTLTSPDPNLKPERAWSEELAIERRDSHGSARVSFFNEIVEDALIAQTAAIPGLAGSYSYVQNVDRTRARGIEVAFDRRDLIPRVDLQASATYTDATTRKDSAFPAAEGKMLPSVPRWKANAVLTWRADDRLSLTGAARYASRNWGTLDNSDVVGNTYMGFYKYLVVDARAHVRVSERYSFAFGVDNLFNDKYFLFHPFPQRAVTAEVKMEI